MAHASLPALVRYCDSLLRTDAVRDWDRAHNGLQVENDGRVTRLAAAVDASLATVRRAIAARADLLLVHHGLFWSDTVPWTGPRRELQRELLTHNLAIYSSHLPLDVHPQLGNNAQLARALGGKTLSPFFEEKGSLIGLRTRTKVAREVLLAKVSAATGAPAKLLPGGPEVCRTIGIVTGGAGSELRRAAAAGVDTFITGEGPHWTFALAEELGLNVIYGGHYATETFGVKALAAHLAAKFRVPWTFVDHPSGL